MAKEKIAILYGGHSAEHEISVITALQAIKAFDTEKYEIIPVYLALNGKWYTGERLFDRGIYRNFPNAIPRLEEVSLLPDSSIGGLIVRHSQKIIPIDACFLAFHGQFGEDGCIQGLLELADLPYTGCGVASSSVAMNKFHSKSIVLAHGISTLPFVLVSKKETLQDLSQVQQKILKGHKFPLIVKPNHLGSSIGISKVRNPKELTIALAKVFQYDDQALIEPCLEKLLELNVAVFESEPPIASVIEIPIAKEGVLSYEDKYLRGGSKAVRGQSAGMAGLNRVIDPQDVNSKIKEKVIQDAIYSFQLLDCGGVCRFDFMLDLETETLYFNEVNPIPGSFAYYLWDKSIPKILYTELISRLIEKAKERKSLHHSLNREFGFHAL